MVFGQGIFYDIREVHYHPFFFFLSTRGRHSIPALACRLPLEILTERVSSFAFSDGRFCISLFLKRMFFFFFRFVIFLFLRLSSCGSCVSAAPKNALCFTTRAHLPVILLFFYFASFFIISFSCFSRLQEKFSPPSPKLKKKEKKKTPLRNVF